MNIINKDLLLYSQKILLDYVDAHNGDDGESGRVVNAIKIISPLLNRINDME